MSEQHMQENKFTYNQNLVIYRESGRTKLHSHLHQKYSIAFYQVRHRATNKQTQEGLQILIELQKKRKNDAQFQIIQEENEKQYDESTNISDQDQQGLSKNNWHFISYEKYQLPPHSFKVTRKGDEELYIPPSIPNIHKDNLIQISELPEIAQLAFRGFKELNTIQKAVYQRPLLKAGKTNIALLTMLQKICEYYQNGIVDILKFQIIYITPMEALVNEMSWILFQLMIHNFQNRLEPYNIKVAEVTVDTHLTKHQLNTIQYILNQKLEVLQKKQEYLDFYVQKTYIKSQLLQSL